MASPSRSLVSFLLIKIVRSLFYGINRRDFEGIGKLHRGRVHGKENNRMKAGAEVTKSFCIFQSNFLRRTTARRTSTKAEINRDL